MEDIEKLKIAATEFANSVDADVLIYNGAIKSPHDAKFIDLCTNNANKRTNAALFLCTYGGDPNVAYRIARCLQQNYKVFTIYVGGKCKSAGTLLAIGANEIVMGEHGQLGPLDIQLGKKDELWETDSGLPVLSAIKTLEEKAFELFENCLLELKKRSGDRISLKTASELALTLAIGVVSPIVSQIDPMHVGEVNRSMKIGLEYGKRLIKFSNNADEGVLKYLTNEYPSHDFVIDLAEAGDIFQRVRKPNGHETDLMNLMGYVAREPNRDAPFCFYISEANGGDLNGADNTQDAGEGAKATGAETGGDEEVRGGASGEPETGGNVMQFPEGVKQSA